MLAAKPDGGEWWEVAALEPRRFLGLHMSLDLRGRPCDPGGERPCDPKTFEGRHDAAMIRLFFDTGMRCGELANLRLDNLDFDLDVAVVHRGR